MGSASDYEYFTSFLKATASAGVLDYYSASHVESGAHKLDLKFRFIQEEQPPQAHDFPKCPLWP